MERAPDISLTAVGSGRQVKLGGTAIPALFICFSQETQAGTERIENAARRVYPKASELLVAHVIDLHKIPGLLRKVAEGVLSSEHKKAMEQVPEGLNRDDYVVILPDWDGSAVKALGLEDATKAAGVALVSRTGLILWRDQSGDPAEALEAFLSTADLN
jgi:hypothetical protein